MTILRRKGLKHTGSFFFQDYFKVDEHLHEENIYLQDIINLFIIHDSFPPAVFKQFQYFACALMVSWILLAAEELMQSNISLSPTFL